VQREAQSEEPTFNSATGWTSKNRSMDAAALAPVGASGSQMAAGFRPQGPMAAPGRDFSEANLPPWLQQGAPPSALPIGGPSGSSGRNSGRGAIPDTDLPPWLRGGGGSQMPAPQSQAGGGQAAGYASPQPGPGTGYDPAWGSQMGGPRPQDGPVQQYADMFADELPGANRRFSFDDDHAHEPADQGGMGEEFEDDWEEPRRGKSRRRWFGRR
jgi:hypothetical protein